MDDDVVQDHPKILVHIVTHNDVDTIVPCVESVVTQSGFTLWNSLFIRITDNASSDGTATLLGETFGATARLCFNTENLGFSRAHNEGITQAIRYKFDYILVLNPDLRLEPNALTELVSVLERDRTAGFACPRLYRADNALNPVTPRRYDSTGMYITPSLRHFDRGSNEPENPEYEKPAYVFGASGACVLLRIGAAIDLSFLDKTENNDYFELFDDSFFAYREDADLAWRAQWRGWKTRYVPSAIGYHRRTVLSTNRTELSEDLNRLGVQNRFLLQWNNYIPELGLSIGLCSSIRNALVVGAVLFKERSSLAGLRRAIALRPQALKRRAQILKGKRVSAKDLSRWFSFKPHTEPVIEKSNCNIPLRSLSIVVVNFNSGNRLGNLLRELTQVQGALAQRLPTNIIVVDNASLDSSAARVQPLFQGMKQVDFISNRTNLGFAAAINQAINLNPADAVLVLNPDVVIRADSVNKLLDSLEAYPSLGAVTPVLLDEQGKSQVGFIARRFPSLGATLAELFLLHRIFKTNRWSAHYRYEEDTLLRSYLELQEPTLATAGYPLATPVLVDQPAAACLLIRGTAFALLNGFDEQFWPAWFEDVDFCKRLEKAGYSRAVLAAAIARHEGGHSVGAISAGTFVRAWYGNLCRYWKKHGSIVVYALVRVTVPIALLIRLGYFKTFGMRAGTIFGDAANTDDLAEAFIQTAVNPTKKQ